MALSIFTYLFILLQLFNILLTCNALPKFSAILIFGDSLLDTGNNNFIPSFAQANHPPYGVSFPGGVATGRFSDGKLMSDFLAEALGIKQLVPPFMDPKLPPSELPTGVCFASAGAGYDDKTSATQVIPVTEQYQKHFKDYKQKLIATVGDKKAADILQNSFMFSTSGSNDMALNFYANPLQAGSIDQYQNFLIGNIAKFIKSLYADGCRNMAIAGLPPICGPLSAGGILGCVFDNNSDANVYNRKLQAMLTQLQSSLPGSKLVYADIFTPLVQISSDPLSHGILFPINCCGEGFPTMAATCNEFVLTCPNPASYMLWDSVHPTQAVYRVMTDFLIKNVLSQF
ncbi:hypothetical protein ACET3Z_007857 [Daucus carota]